MATDPKSQKRPDPAAAYDQRTELVKDMVARENALLDAKTERLRALRLAKQAEVPPAGAPPEKPRRRRR